MPPRAPEIVLAAIVAAMRATARKLHDDSAAFPVISVASMIDEFPTDAAGIEITDNGRGRILDDPMALKCSEAGASWGLKRVFAKYDPGHLPQIPALFERGN